MSYTNVRISKMKLRILLTIIGLCIGFHPSSAQEDIEKLKSKLLSLTLPQAWQIKRDSNKIRFEMTDTMALCQYDISPLRNFDTSTLSTYKLELTFEANWTKKRLKRTQKRNEELIEYIRARLISYGDSLNWRGVKTNKRWVEENPMNYLYIMNNWTESEKEMIAKVVRLPNDIVDNVGVFVWVNTLCVVPERKDQLILELYSQLNILGIHTENFNWRNEKY